VNHESPFFVSGEQLRVSARSSIPQISLSPGVLGAPSHAICDWTPEVHLTNDIQIRRTVKAECADATDDRQQTDRPRYGEMCRNRRNRWRCKKNDSGQ